MQTGKRPLGVGLSFSLGHSTIVILATIGIAWTAHSLHGRFETFKAVGGTIGTLVSASFLLVLAAVNLVILRDVWRRIGTFNAAANCRADRRTRLRPPVCCRAHCVRCSGS